jgi:hypothetical protein
MSNHVQMSIQVRAKSTTVYKAYVRRIYQVLNRVLVMTRKRPTIKCHCGRGNKITGRHPRPLWVKQHLQRVGTSRKINDKYSHSWVCLIRDRRSDIRSKPDGSRRRECRSRRWANHRNQHRLTVQRQCCRCTRAIDANGSVCMHAPLNIRTGGDFVLNQNLTAGIEKTAAALDRCSG